jgi:hypothetical protein
MGARLGVARVALNLGEDPLGARLNAVLPGKLGKRAPLPEKSGVSV